MNVGNDIFTFTIFSKSKVNLLSKMHPISQVDDEIRNVSTFIIINLLQLPSASSSAAFSEAFFSLLPNSPKDEFNF